MTKRELYVSLENSEYFSLFIPKYEWLNIFLYLNFLESISRNCTRLYEIWVCMRNKLIGKVRIGRTGSKLIQKFLEKWSMFRVIWSPSKIDVLVYWRLCFKTNRYNSSWFIYLSNVSFLFSYFVNIREKSLFNILEHIIITKSFKV